MEIMKLLVRRTSGLGWLDKPCEEAVKTQFHGYAEFCSRGLVDDDETLLRYVHKLEDAGCRDIRLINNDTLRGTEIEPTHAYMVEINTLEELIAFVNKYGDCIILKPDCEEQLFLLEIYDDYRE
jgi:hypothetical protein